MVLVWPGHRSAGAVACLTRRIFHSHGEELSITFNLIDNSGGNAAATSNVTVLLIADVATG